MELSRLSIPPGGSGWPTGCLVSRMHRGLLGKRYAAQRYSRNWCADVFVNFETSHAGGDDVVCRHALCRAEVQSSTSGL